MDPSPSGPSRPPTGGIDPAGSEPAVTGADSDRDTAAATTDTAHLARFEFSTDGTTKILMVEWYPDAVPSEASVSAATEDGHHHERQSQPSPSPVGQSCKSPGSGAGRPPSSDAASAAWQVSWPGKSTTLPARDKDADRTRRRVYFLLPPDAPVPATVAITSPGRPTLTLKPLPAIFPEGFADDAGTRGVLHTIWARKRLAELEREMDAELRTNAESVGLEMALAEKQWIVDNFIRSPVAQPPSPVASRSPGGVNRLGDKLRGLKLATSPADLAPSPTANTFTSAGSQSHTLSPGGADIAVSSFSSISDPQPHAGPISLDAALKGEVTSIPGGTINKSDSQDTEDDLFALPMSPRSPDMAKSPFSALR